MPKASHESWSIVINQSKLHIKWATNHKSWFPIYTDTYKHLLFTTRHLFVYSSHLHFPYIHYIYIYTQLIIPWSYTHVWSIFLYPLNTLYVYEYWIHNIYYPWLYIIHYAELLFYACTHDMPPFSRPVYICSKLALLQYIRMAVQKNSHKYRSS